MVSRLCAPSSVESTGITPAVIFCVYNSRSGLGPDRTVIFVKLGSIYYAYEQHCRMVTDEAIPAPGASLGSTV